MRPVKIAAENRCKLPSRYEGCTVEEIIGSSSPLSSLRAGVSTIPGGTSVGMHYHSVEAMEFILSGRALVHDLDGNTLEMEQGDAVLFPPGPESAHSWDYLGDEPCVILWMHTGPGKDTWTWVDEDQ